MPTERVLIEIVTAANMAGVKEAQAGFLGFTPQVLLAGAALAGLVFVGKSAVENYEAQTKANLSLAQAAGATHVKFEDLRKEFEAWAETNKRYISNQYEAETALAAFVRAGANAKDAMRELNDALDLSTLRGLSMDEAQKNITLALTGSSKALKVLGITTEEYSAIMKDKTLTVEQQHLRLLALIEGKIKDGRHATTELEQSQHELNKDWQDFTARIGPGVVRGLEFITKAADEQVQQLGAIGDLLGSLIQKGQGLAGAFSGAFQGTPTGKRVAPRGGRRAGGGDVFAGTDYLVGESGPEILTMGASGGHVTPGVGSGGRGGGVININIAQGAYIDGPSVDRLANIIALRMGYATGR